jgi:hypothetical protein
MRVYYYFLYWRVTAFTAELLANKYENCNVEIYIE